MQAPFKLFVEALKLRNVPDFLQNGQLLLDRLFLVAVYLRQSTLQALIVLDCVYAEEKETS